jgi:hypothetical protein
MSFGLVVCSVCKREVHQDRDNDKNLYWYHCDTKSRICHEGYPDYPRRKDDIKGDFCGRDDLDGVFVTRPRKTR